MFNVGCSMFQAVISHRRLNPHRPHHAPPRQKPTSKLARSPAPTSAIVKSPPSKLKSHWTTAPPSPLHRYYTAYPPLRRGCCIRSQRILQRPISLSMPSINIGLDVGCADFLNPPDPLGVPLHRRAGESYGTILAVFVIFNRYVVTHSDFHRAERSRRHLHRFHFQNFRIEVVISPEANGIQHKFRFALHRRSLTNLGIFWKSPAWR